MSKIKANEILVLFSATNLAEDDLDLIDKKIILRFSTSDGRVVRRAARVVNIESELVTLDATPAPVSLNGDLS